MARWEGQLTQQGCVRAYLPVAVGGVGTEQRVVHDHVRLDVLLLEAAEHVLGAALVPHAGVALDDGRVGHGVGVQRLLAQAQHAVHLWHHGGVRSRDAWNRGERGTASRQCTGTSRRRTHVLVLNMNMENGQNVASRRF